MTVCNSCRYCEGLCAVFPAMEMRRAFPDGDLNYLANLCHSCGACYVDCQFSPPHEFDVNVPRVLAQVRGGIRMRPMRGRGRWRRCSRATAWRSAWWRRSASRRSSSASRRGTMRRVLFGTHTGPGAFYRLMPHNAMAALFGAVFLYAIVALAMGVRAFWRDIGDPVSLDAGLALAGDPRCRTAALSRWRRHRLLQPRRTAERPAPLLSPPDVLRLHAVLRVDLRGDASITTPSAASRPIRGGTCRWCSAPSAASG